MIPAVVLAAGKSTRMGRAKATLPLGPSDTFLTRIVRTCQEAEVDDIVVVLGHDAETIRESVTTRGLMPRFVINPDYENGQLSSILTGLGAIDRPGVTAMLLMLVDVPLVSAATIRAVLQHYRATHLPIVRPARGAVHGHPVLLDRALFPLLRAADPALGAKPIVRAHTSAAGDLPIVDNGAFVDIDTPDDYASEIEQFNTLKNQ
jgi:molybdenum cofactor cytidylyltransferase